jgi:hypothetical protein
VSDWLFLRAGLVTVGVLCGLAVAGWGVYSVVHEEPGLFAKVTGCLVREKGAPLAAPRDPIAQSAELGAVRTLIETNGVTISVASSAQSADRIVAAYRQVAGDLRGRLERRGRLVYLWDRPASPTQRQAAYDCQY